MPYQYEKSNPRVLIVVKDHHEFKIFFNQYTLKQTLAEYNVDVLMPPLAMDTRQRLTEEFPGLDFQYKWPATPAFLQKILFWIYTQLFFLSLSYKSESCFQKVVISFFAVLGFFRKERGGGLKYARTILSSDIQRIVTKVILFPGVLIGKLFFLVVSTSKINNHRVDTKKKLYKYIVFGRPNSLINKDVYQKYFVDSTTQKIVTVCRNLDTPYLKGPFVVPSDITIVLDSIVKCGLEELFPKKMYGQIIERKSHLEHFALDNIEAKARMFLYASTDPYLSPNEPSSVLILYRTLERLFGTDFKLTIRLIHSDSIERYECLSEMKNIYFDLSLLNADFKPGEYEAMFCSKDDVDGFYEYLKTFDWLFSSTSTLNYEAKKLGLKTAYIGFDQSLAWLYQREHLKKIMEEYSIPLLMCSKDLENLLNND